MCNQMRSWQGKKDDVDPLNEWRKYLGFSRFSYPMVIEEENVGDEGAGSNSAHDSDS